MSESDALLTLIADDLCDVHEARRRSRDLTVLWISLAVIALSFALRVRPDQRVALLGLDRLPAPEMCGSRLWFGIECPGCGLTRGFIQLAAGDWSNAIALNRVTPLLAFAVLMQIPYRLASLLAWPPAGRFGDSTWSTACGWVLIVALIGNWLLKLAGV
ncbi:MAG: hypothetical protein FD138_4396 [Planctomycetota bacterium]|nr:MAG: hypothetical protein FD138_4396 [Planctomycetota bacterium]